MTKTLILGIQRGKPGSGNVLVPSASGARLAKLIGISQSEILERFEVDNLFEDDADVTLEGARVRLAALLMGPKPPERVIGLGDIFRASLKLSTWPFTWHQLGDTKVAWTPHPSGRNRFWNDQENVTRAADFWSSQV